MEEEKNMDIPIKNKEALDPKDTIVVSRLKYRIAVLSAVFGFILSFLTTIVPFAKEVFISDQKQMLRKVEDEMEIDNIKDSMQALIDIKIQEQTYKDISKIYELMDEMRKELPESAQISLYYTHDSGGVPVTGSALNLTILYVANNIEPCLGKSYWHNAPLPEGYFNYNRRLFQEKFIYIPDVTLDKDVYITETREDLDCNQSKAMMGVVIKETAYGVYYISVGWNIAEPDLRNFKAKTILRKYASDISVLIEGKKKQ